MTDLASMLAGLRAAAAVPATDDEQKQEPAGNATATTDEPATGAGVPKSDILPHDPAGEFVPPPPAPVVSQNVEEREEHEAQTVATRAAQRAAPTPLPSNVTPDVILHIPAPRPHQRVVLDDDHRFKGWRAGRRVGKSRTEFIAAVRGHGPMINTEPDPTKPPQRRRKFKGMAHGGDILWIAPDYGQSETIWEEEVLPRFHGRRGITVSEKHRLIGFGKQLGVDAGGEPVYRGSLRIRSAENINSVRGKEFDGIIGEEAAFWKFLHAWRRVLRPTLINRKGWAIIASSTDLGSDFNQLMAEIEAGKRGANWSAFHHRTRDNPYIDEEEKADLAHDYPPGSAEELQELDAELLETLGTLFRTEFFHTYDAINTQAVWINGLRYVFEFLVLTADLASRLKEINDYTAFTIAGVCFPVDGIRRVAMLEIVNEKMEGPDQIDALEELALRYRPAYIDIESFGYQITAVQHLERKLRGMGLTISGIELKGDKRTKAVPAASAMSRGEWWFPNPEHAPWMAQAKAQALKFPNGRAGSTLVVDHDDVIDTWSLLAARVGGRTNTTWRMRKIRAR